MPRFEKTAFLWPSGYHYTLTYGKQEDGSFEWDDRDRFDRVAAPHAVHHRDGEVYAQKRSWLRGGSTSCMCPGDPWTIDWLNNIAVQIVRRGVEMVQVDQVVGARFPACYSREHGHPPGHGRQKVISRVVLTRDGVRLPQSLHTAATLRKRPVRHKSRPADE